MAKKEELDYFLPDDFETTVTLHLDDGDMECAVYSIFDAPVPEKYGDGRYIALLPIDPDLEEEVFIYRYKEDESGEPDLENITSDEEYEIVEEAFDELLDATEYEALLEDDEDE